MAQQVGTLADLSKDFGSIPSPHVVTSDLQGLLQTLGTHTYTHLHTQIK